MNRGTTTVAVGIALLVLTLGLIPGAVPPIERNEMLYELAESSLRSEAGGAQPSKADVDRRYQGFMTEQWFNWTKTSLLLTLSVAAIVLTVGMRRRTGLWLVCLVCAVMLFTYVPPLVKLSMHGGFFEFAAMIFNHSGKRALLDGVLLYWHAIVAPFAYALLAVATVVALARRVEQPT